MACFEKFESDGKCSGLVANDMTKEECCNQFGIGYSEPMNNEIIFMMYAGMRTQSCKPCKGMNVHLHAIFFCCFISVIISFYLLS